MINYTEPNRSDMTTSNLSKGKAGQELYEFIMCTVATDPIDFFDGDWDEDRYLLATKDAKTWWTIQKLSGW
jgi:hypothetical protein